MILLYCDLQWKILQKKLLYVLVCVCVCVCFMCANVNLVFDVYLVKSMFV
jgi:hypothetical protein